MKKLQEKKESELKKQADQAMQKVIGIKRLNPGTAIINEDHAIEMLSSLKKPLQPILPPEEYLKPLNKTVNFGSGMLFINAVLGQDDDANDSLNWSTVTTPFKENCNKGMVVKLITRDL